MRAEWITIKFDSEPQPALHIKHPMHLVPHLPDKSHGRVMQAQNRTELISALALYTCALYSLLDRSLLATILYY